MVRFDLRLSVNDNAGIIFEKAKKLKQKLEGIEKTIAVYEQKRDSLQKESHEAEQELTKKRALKQRKTEWFEKFRWFYTSQGNLCVGGRDSSTNEMIIKKYTDDADYVFHTDMAGSPFFILKTDAPSDEELEEVATVTACYSKAWKKGLTSTDVFYVKGDQVTKEANTGEYLSKGSFMIRGKTTYVANEMKLCISYDEKERIFPGSQKTMSKKEKYAILVQGDRKSSDVAKELKSFFRKGLLDDYIKVIPPGGAKVLKKITN